MITIDDMNFATGFLILAAIIGLFFSPIALIISAIVYGIRKKMNRGNSFWSILWPILGIGSGSLTAIFIVYSIIFNLIGN